MGGTGTGARGTSIYLRHVSQAHIETHEGGAVLAHWAAAPQVEGGPGEERHGISHTHIHREREKRGGRRL